MRLTFPGWNPALVTNVTLCLLRDAVAAIAALSGARVRISAVAPITGAGTFAAIPRSEAAWQATAASVCSRTPSSARRLEPGEDATGGLQRRLVPGDPSSRVEVEVALNVSDWALATGQTVEAAARQMASLLQSAMADGARVNSTFRASLTAACANAGWPADACPAPASAVALLSVTSGVSTADPSPSVAPGGSPSSGNANNALIGGVVAAGAVLLAAGAAFVAYRRGKAMAAAGKAVVTGAQAPAQQLAGDSTRTRHHSSVAAISGFSVANPLVIARA